MEFNEENTRGNGTRMTTDIYSNQAMDRLKRLLENFYISGEEKYYAVLVDGEIVVPKTSDPESYDNYKEFVNELTRQVIVRLYYGNSPNCNTYKFDVIASGQLSGTQLADMKISEALDKHKREQHIIDLQKKIRRLKKKNAKLLIELEENDSLLTTKNADKFKEIASIGMGLVNSFRNPAQTANLSGFNQGQEAEVSFDPSVDAENLKMLEMLEDEYGAEQTREILHLVIRLAQHEDLLGTIGEALHERESRKKSKK